MSVCTAATLLALGLTAAAYRAPPTATAPGDGAALRFGLPPREAVQVSLVGMAWAAFNASLILLVSFAPDALLARGWAAADARSAASLTMWAAMVSLPLGGRLMERFGHVTLGITVFLLLAACFAVLLFLGRAPAVSFVLFGLAAGVPGGALVALSSEAVSPGNRGPGLGLYYTWYYAGMTAAPALAGGLRDASQHAGAPLILAAALMVATVAAVLSLRVLQARWPIRVTAERPDEG